MTFFFFFKRWIIRTAPLSSEVKGGAINLQLDVSPVTHRVLYQRGGR